MVNIFLRNEEYVGTLVAYSVLGRKILELGVMQIEVKKIDVFRGKI